MTVFIATLIGFGLAVFAMSIGVIFGNRRIKGSCGGMNNLKKLFGISPCDACHEKSPQCGLRPEPQQESPHD